MAEFLKQELIWTRKPERVFMDETKVEIITESVSYTHLTLPTN